MNFKFHSNLENTVQVNSSSLTPHFVKCEAFEVCFTFSWAPI